MISYDRSTDTITKTPAPPLLSERGAAAYLGLSLDALRHQVNIGALKYLGTRRRMRFLQDSLDRWRQKQPQKKTRGRS